MSITFQFVSRHAERKWNPLEKEGGEGEDSCVEREAEEEGIERERDQ